MTKLSKFSFSFLKKKKERKRKAKGITRIEKEAMWMNLMEGIMDNTIRN